jgi:hypothetical protein
VCFFKFDLYSFSGYIIAIYKKSHNLKEYFMPRKDFISNRWGDMREQLRDSYTSYHQKKSDLNNTEHPELQIDPENVPETDSPMDAVEHPVETDRRKNPSFSAEINSVNERERRELEGRIAHDLAELDSRQELLEHEMAELRRFREILNDTRNNLFSGDFNKFRLNYFAARGRWNAFESNTPAFAQSESATPAEGRGAYWIAGAVLVSSVIMALTLVALFA